MSKDKLEPTGSDLVRKLDLAEQVGRLHLKGKNPNQIASELSIQRREVTRALDDFRGLLRRQSETAVDVRERLMDILFESDEAFRMVIDEAWTTVSQADDTGSLNTKVQALKVVESATKNRTEMLQKSGVSQDDEIIEQLNETQRNQELLVDILKEIRTKHPQVAELISRKLSKVTGQVEPIEEVSIEREGNDMEATG